MSFWRNKFSKQGRVERNVTNSAGKISKISLVRLEKNSIKEVSQMKIKEVKVSGHILERNILGILFGALKDKEVDITDY